MKTTSHNLALDLALLYDEPVSETEANVMADRLLNFVDLLLEIESEGVETP
jgi:hypothetical protein